MMTDEQEKGAAAFADIEAIAERLNPEDGKRLVEALAFLMGRLYQKFSRIDAAIARGGRDGSMEL